MTNCPQITLEMLNIYHVKPHHCCIYSYVQLSQLITQDERPAICVHKLLKSVESSENGDYVLVIRGLICGKTGFIDSSIEIGLDPCA